MEYLTQNEFEKLPKFKEKKSIRVKGHNLYKMISINYLAFAEYLVSIDHCRGLVLPESIFGNGRFFNGYTAPIIPMSLDLDEYFLKVNPFPIDKIVFLKKILKLVEIANRNFIIGDVRNSNILITQKQPYLIDFENGKKLYDPMPLSTYYQIKCDDQILPESVLSDRIKALISALTIYYNLNIEQHYFNKDIIELAETLIDAKACKSILNYLDYLIAQAIKKEFDVVKPFSNFSTNLEPPRVEDSTRLLVRI